MTVAKAVADEMPKTEMATAIASSKLLPLAVNASVAARSYSAPARRAMKYDAKNMIAK